MVVAVQDVRGVIIPEPRTVLKAKETVMAVVKVAGLEKIKESLKIAEG